MPPPNSDNPQEGLRINSLAQEEILLAVASLPPNQRYGAVILEVTSFSAGTLYPALRTLTSRDLVIPIPEKGDARQLERPLRVYYEIPDAAKGPLISYLDSKEQRIHEALKALRKG